MKITSTSPYKFKWVGIGLLLIGCGGGGSGGSSDAAGSQQDYSGAPSGQPLPDTAAPDSSQPALALPASVANGSTVELECGRLYRGSLNLNGKTNVSVKTNGTCGKAVITPGQEITGWTRHQGNIWVAPIAFDAAQVITGGTPVAKAHWPGKSQTWVTSTSTSANSLSYVMPNSDLSNATLVFKQHEWSIEARRITGYSGNTINFTSTGNPAFYDFAATQPVKFYVEGKLWMLDEADEWVVSDGKLYLWAPDGQSPEGRTWASPDTAGIDATNSTGISVDGVRIYGASNGIAAQGAKTLHVTNTEIVNSSENGILNTGGSGLNVDAVVVRNTRHNAIVVRWGGGGEVIRNSTFDSTGNLGMPTNSYGAVTLTLATGSTLSGNRISNAGYIGMRVFENATVSRNTIEGACQVMSDCGGIYASSENQQPLNARIEDNVIKNTSPGKRLSWGLQLDDANTVSVARNTFSGNDNGIMLFNSSNISISENRFESNVQAHIQMAESRSSGVRNNSVANNTFVSASGGEMYRISSDMGTSAVSQFSSYGGNSYSASSGHFANFNGEALSFTQWKSRTGQDGSSTYTGP
jgi:parallel beta-helix repeat protein